MTEAEEKTQAKDRPGVITHPPFLYLGFLLAGLALDTAWSLPIGLAGVRGILGGGLIAAGVALLGWGVAHFVRAGTNVPTSKPATALVTGGPFRFTRNPLYVALALVYGGLAVLLDSLWPLILLPALLVVMTYGVIKREERYLEGKFGEAYTAYRSRVRRWL